MFLNNLIRYFSGYITFNIQNGSCEKFINLVAKNNINLWCFEKTDVGFIATAKAYNYNDIINIAKNSNVDIHIIEKSGFLFKIKKYRYRFGILSGIIIFFGFIILSQLFVWDISVIGNSKTPSSIILSELNEIGVSKLKYIPSLDLRIKKEEALLKLPSLSWLTINRYGCKLVVEVSENNTPPIISNKTPTNIVAAKTGQIRYMEVYNGKKVALLNHTVSKGDILVTGHYKDKDDIDVFTHADAKIIAEVQFDKTLYIDVNQLSKEYTGKVKNRYSLDIFSLKLPLYIATNIKGSYDLTTEYIPLMLFGQELPIGISKSSYSFYDKKDTHISNQEAKRIINKVFYEYEMTELNNSIILSSSSKESVVGDIFKVTKSYIVEQDIAHKLPID